MTDRELIELAAKAAGYEYECTSHTGRTEDDQHQIRSSNGSLIDWNPLIEDGDALRLASLLSMKLDPIDGWLFAVDRLGRTGKCELWREDCYRRAIVRAAAEIGKAM